MNDFEKTVKFLASELKRDLPGFSAQKLMAPLGRKPPIEYLKENIVPKKSAVLILIFPGEWHLPKTVLILRPEKENGPHAGQISFPGGRYDSADGDLSKTALREAYEEIGIETGRVRIIGNLSPLYIPVSNFMVHPFVGVLNGVPDFRIHRDEVEDLLEVSLADFLVETNQTKTERFIRIKGRMMEVPCYTINGRIIWGATAMIISELSEILKKLTSS